MEQMTGLDFKLGEIAGRIRELREIEGLTAADMAKKTAVSEEEYLACENGRSDLNFTAAHWLSALMLPILLRGKALTLNPTP